MSDHVVPHFHNDAGVSVIEIGSQEFMCVGANPPFDHPHVFLDLGNDNEIICPYCSTLYRFAADLGAPETRLQVYQPLVLDPWAYMTVALRAAAEV